MMKEFDAGGLKKFSKHLLECQTHSRQLPKELTELQDYLKQLSGYVEKYNRVKANIAEQEIRVPDDRSPYETSFSVKEDVEAGRTAVEILLVPPPEPVTVISPPEGKDSDVASDVSEIGIYYIEDVLPIKFINVIQRELSTLIELFPSVGRIVEEMKKEFDHFKVCSGCLIKISSLLPDILKEVQELIKFIKKKRNEVYVWPDDSEYLRKSTEGSSKPFKKEEKDPEKVKTREKTVRFVTVHTKKPKFLRKVESSILGEQTARSRSEDVRRCSVRLINCPQLSVFQSETQSNLRFIEKLETLEKVNEVVAGRSDRDESFLTEFSTAQVLRILHPVPALERAVQLKVIECVTHSAPNADGIRFVTLEKVTGEESENPLAVQAKEFLMTARIALGEACLALQQKGKMGTEKELKTDVRDLKDLMIEAHKNQIALSKVLLEKGVLNAAVVQLTDPKMLYEEKQGIEKAKKSLSDGGRMLENPTIEELQRLVEDLKHRCNVKNRMIIALLNGLRSNVPKQHWEELITYVLQESGLGNLEEFLRKTSQPGSDHQVLRCQDWKTYTRKELSVEEISEKEMKRTYGRSAKPGKDRARISFSEVISKTSKCLHAIEANTKLGTPQQTSIRTVRGLREMNSEAERLLKDLESEVNSITKRKNRCRVDKMRRDRLEETAGSVKTEPGSATINLTIKIGDEEAMSQYQSAMSVITSGTTLTEKKSEISLPTVVERVPNVQFIAEDTAALKGASASGSFTSLAVKVRVPMTFREDSDMGGSKKVATLQENVAEPTPDPVVKDTPVSKPSNESVTGKPMAETESDMSTLYPQITVHCEHNLTMQKLRSRLSFLEESLRSLTRTIDRMDVLTDKLSDDAFESYENFKDIVNRYRFISNLLGS